MAVTGKGTERTERSIGDFQPMQQRKNQPEKETEQKLRDSWQTSKCPPFTPWESGGGEGNNGAGKIVEVIIAENVPNWGKDKHTVLTSLAIQKKLTQRKPCPATSQRAQQNPQDPMNPRAKGRMPYWEEKFQWPSLSPPNHWDHKTVRRNLKGASLCKRSQSRKAVYRKLPTRYSGKGRRTDRRKVGGGGRSFRTLRLLCVITRESQPQNVQHQEGPLL